MHHLTTRVITNKNVDMTKSRIKTKRSWERPWSCPLSEHRTAHMYASVCLRHSQTEIEPFFSEPASGNTASKALALWLFAQSERYYGGRQPGLSIITCLGLEIWHPLILLSVLSYDGAISTMWTHTSWQGVMWRDDFWILKYQKSIRIILPYLKIPKNRNIFETITGILKFWQVILSLCSHF